MNAKSDTKRGAVPLWAQVAIAVGCGVVTGHLLGAHGTVLGVGVETLGRLGMLVIRALKTLAIPLVMFSILDALLRYRIEGMSGWKLLRICLVNVTVALGIGLLLVNTLQPGVLLRKLFAPFTSGTAAHAAHAPAPALDPMAGLDGLVPTNVLQPFLENSVLGVVLLALVAGAALRTVRERRGKEAAATFTALEGFVGTLNEALQVALGWVVRLVPIGAFGLVAQAVGRAGLQALTGLWGFLAVIALGMTLHAFVYYPLMAWVRGGRRPLAFLSAARDAMVTAVASNSSLATVPVTLRCLTEKLRVSQQSSRLAACIGTNLNNDGITLYEAMAVLIIAQACGMDLGLAQQGAVVAASLLAGLGIAGIPEAGLVVLPMVLATAGLPDAVVAAAIPLVVPVDWILARYRSVVNVLSDMLVAVLLDAGEAPAAELAPAPVPAPERAA